MGLLELSTHKLGCPAKLVNLVNALLADLVLNNVVYVYLLAFHLRIFDNLLEQSVDLVDVLLPVLVLNFSLYSNCCKHCLQVPL